MDRLNLSHESIITALYVPADRPDRIAKALRIDVDSIIIDLEDSVTYLQKKDARRKVEGFFERNEHNIFGAKSIQLRLNSVGTEWFRDDVELLGRLPKCVDARVPKVEGIADIHAVTDSNPERHVHALVESPEGVEHAFEIAGEGVATLGLGEADLRSSLGLPGGAAGDNGLNWARSRVINAAAARGLPAPLMSPYTDIRDSEGLQLTCEAGEALGFGGRVAIHPRQVPTINACFQPSAEDAAAARKVINRLGEARDVGRGVVVLEDGTFLDAAMIRNAERIVAVYNQRESRRSITVNDDGGL